MGKNMEQKNYFHPLELLVALGMVAALVECINEGPLLTVHRGSWVKALRKLSASWYPE